MDSAAITCDQVSFFPFCLGDAGKKERLFPPPPPHPPKKKTPDRRLVQQQNPRCKQNIWQSNQYNYTRFWKEHARPRQWLLTDHDKITVISSNTTFAETTAFATFGLYIHETVARL